MEQYINRIINADCLDILKQLPDKCVDLVLTDPPYGIGMDKNMGLSKKYVEKNWDKEIPSKKIFDEIFRVSKNQIIFGGNYFKDYLPNASWLLWDKRCGIIPERTYADGELAFVSYKEPLRIFRFVWDGMLQENMKEKEIRFHPTQKPVKLFEMILNKYSNENDLVLDCFSGSGTTAVACHNLKRRFICIEKDPEYWKASCERLEQAQRQQVLF